jgi:hypothetical protein
MLVNIIQNTISSFRSALAAAEVITTNLKMWLGFETSSVDGDNQITPDKSGNNNVGELFTGKALDFNGSTDYVDVDGFQMAGTNVTFAFWFNSNDTLGRFFDIITGFSNRFILSFNNNQISILDDTVSWFNFGSVTTNVWNRCVITINGTTAKCFVNGVQLGKYKTISTIDFSSSTDAAIGSMVFGTQSYFDGSLSDFQIYNSAWTSDDVAFDYANPNKLAIDNPSTSLNVTNLKAYWALSEGDGLVAYDSGTNLEEEEVVDGNFPTGTTAWDLLNGATISNNKANIIGDGSLFTSIKQTGVFENGKIYQVVVDVTITSGLGLKFQDGANNENIGFATTTGVYTFNFTGTSNADLVVGRRTSGTAFNSNVNSISVREVTASDHGGLINGATYVDAQPRIPQLGMMNWAKSTPVADEITLIPNPTIPTQDILGNAVRDRLNSFNLGEFGGARVDDITLSGNQVTFQLWFKNVNSNDSLYLADIHSATDRIVLGFNSSQLSAYHELTGSWQNFGVITDGDWNFATFTFDGTTLKCFVGTSQLGVTKTITAINIGTTEQFGIGMNHYFPTRTQDYNGHISDFLIYDRVLTSDEIENNYNAGLSAHTND